MFTFIWGVENKAYLSFFSLIPLPFWGFIWMFVCGIKGNQWAWESGKFETVEEFERCQKTWNRAGILAFIFQCIYFIFSITFFILYFFFLFSPNSPFCVGLHSQ